MGTLTIRNLPDDLVERLKAAAAAHQRSMEQEVRELLQRRYAPKAEVLARLRSRWGQLPRTSAEDVRQWREEGRR